MLRFYRLPKSQFLHRGNQSTLPHKYEDKSRNPLTDSLYWKIHLVAILMQNERLAPKSHQLNRQWLQLGLNLIYRLKKLVQKIHLDAQDEYHQVVRFVLATNLIPLVRHDLAIPIHLHR